MRSIQLSVTAGPDGRLRLEVPVGQPGEYQVTVTPLPAANGTTPEPTPEELGWSPEFLREVMGSIDDDTFTAPLRGRPAPAEPLDLG